MFSSIIQLYSQGKKALANPTSATLLRSALSASHQTSPQSPRAALTNNPSTVTIDCSLAGEDTGVSSVADRSPPVQGGAAERSPLGHKSEVSPSEAKKFHRSASKKGLNVIDDLEVVTRNLLDIILLFLNLFIFGTVEQLQ